MKTQKILTDKHDALLQTGRTILERCTQYPTVTVLVPRFADLIVLMQTAVAQIDAAVVAKQSSRSTKDVTKQKNDGIADLIAFMDELAIIAVDIANYKKNADWTTRAEKALKKNVKDNSEEGILLVAREFALFLRSIGAETLTYFGIEEAEVVEIETKVKDINDWRVRKDLAIDQKSLDNKAVVDLFDKLENIKTQMDNLSGRFVTKSPEFFAAYDKATYVNQKVGAKSNRTKKDTPSVEGNTVSNGAIKTSASADTVETKRNI